MGIVFKKKRLVKYHGTTKNKIENVALDKNKRKKNGIFLQRPDEKVDRIFEKMFSV